MLFSENSRLCELTCALFTDKLHELEAELRLVSETSSVKDVRLEGGYRCGERITASYEGGASASNAPRVRS